MSRRDKKVRHPPKWVANVYRLLAAGRFSARWLPEFLILYDLYVLEEGEEAANNWALKELALSIKPALALRFLGLFRLVFKAWEIYRKIARD